MDDGILRQRRNLIGTSFALTLYYSAGIQLSTKVSYLGTEFSVERPEVLLYVAWFLWAYFGLRYWQYFSVCSQMPSIKELYLSGLLDIQTQHFGVRENKSNDTINGIMYPSQGSSFPLASEGVKSFIIKLKSYKNPIFDGPIRLVFPSWLSLFTWQINSIFRIFVNKHGSDYLYPFIAALAPIVACIFHR